MRRIDDGACFPIPPSEIKDWKEMTDRVVTSDEYAILRAMDTVFCEKTNDELQAYHARRAEESRLSIEAAQAAQGGKRRG